MAARNNDDGINAFQTFSTLLALLLPVLQFFFNFLPTSAQSIFVIKDILIPVTIVAGVFSYLLIIAFKNVGGFNLAFNRKKKKEYENYQNQINYLLRNESDESKRETQAKQLLKNPVIAPWYLTPWNIYMILIPLLFFFVVAFLAIGVFGVDTTSRLLILLQSISYIFSVALTSLTLAVFYINETNRKNNQRQDRERYQKIIQLLFDNNSLPEFPKIEFVAQNNPDFMTLQTYIRVNDMRVYAVTTDYNGDILKQVIIDTRENIHQEKESL